MIGLSITNPQNLQSGSIIEQIDASHIVILRFVSIIVRPRINRQANEGMTGRLTV